MPVRARRRMLRPSPSARKTETSLDAAAPASSTLHHPTLWPPRLLPARSSNRSSFFVSARKNSPVLKRGASRPCWWQWSHLCQHHGRDARATVKLLKNSAHAVKGSLYNSVSLETTHETLPNVAVACGRIHLPGGRHSLYRSIP